MKEQLLSQVPLFAALPAKEIELLASTLRECEIAQDTVMFREDEPADRFYILLDGQLEIIKALGTPDQKLLGVRGPGSFIGEMGLLSANGRRTASVRARTPLKLLEMTRADFDALLHREPMLAYEMMRVLSARLHELENMTIIDLREKNRQLTEAYEELKAAQTQIIEKEKLERELEVAREIQQSILPRRLPTVAGFDFGARMAPTRAVGGDFFDFIRLDGDQLGIVIGDVSDKGVPAAIFMALTSSLLRAEAIHASSPREALRSVNRQLLEVNDTGMFVTVLYGVLNISTRKFTYVRAGHELPILFDATGELSALPPGAGQPLGLLRDPVLDEQKLTLAPQSTLLLYTDGVTDATSAQNEFFGLERLHDAVRGKRTCPAPAICDQLFEEITEFCCGMPQHDDITLLAVQVTER